MKRFEKSEAAFRRFLNDVPIAKKLSLWKEVKEKNLGGISMIEYFSLFFESITYNFDSIKGDIVSFAPTPPNNYEIKNYKGSEFCTEPFFL